jgi:hypothetical protein
MLFENTTLLLLWIACTYFIVQIMFGIQDALREVNNDLEKQLIKRLDEIVHRVEVVEENSMYYWFDQDNNKFLAQGRTTEEIIDIIKARFPDHVFYFEKSNHLICAKHGWRPQPARLPDKSQ